MGLASTTLSVFEKPKDPFSLAFPLPEDCKKPPISQWDIANARNKILSDYEKFNYLTNPWKPPSGYNFIPVTQSKRQRYDSF